MYAFASDQAAELDKSTLQCSHLNTSLSISHIGITFNL